MVLCEGTVTTDPTELPPETGYLSSDTGFTLNQRVLSLVICVLCTAIDVSTEGCVVPLYPISANRRLLYTTPL